MSPHSRARTIALALFAGLLAAAVAAAAAATPLTPLAALVVGAVLLLAMVRPIAAVYLAVLLVALESFSTGFGESFGVTPVELVAVAAALGWLYRLLIDGPVSIRSPLTLPLVLLLAAHLPGLFLADDRFAVLKQLLMWSAFFVLYVAVLTDRNPATSSRLALAIAASGAIVAAVTVAQSAGAQQAIGPGGGVADRAAGPFGSPTLVGAFIGMALPLQLLLMLRGRPEWRRVAGTVATLLSFAALALTMTRSAFVGIGIVAIWLVVWWRPFRRLVVVVASVVGLIVITGVNPVKAVVNTDVLIERVKSATTTQTASAQARLEIWKATPGMIRDNLPFGVGADNFDEHAGEYALFGPDYVALTHAHNVPLTIAAQLGVPGVFALVWIVVALWRTMRRALQQSTGPDHSLAVGLVAAFLALAVVAIFDYMLSANVFTLVVLLLIALAARVERMSAPAEPLPAPEPEPTSARRELVPV